MDKEALIEMLNKDMGDEHAAIIRYLVHGWLEGEDTPLGASLISISREEMWHMHWLGMVVGELGGEPNFTPEPYPFDPTNRATILKSYVEYEEKLVPHYHAEAEKVDDPHIRRVLHREAWESALHARKFQRRLDKLSPEEAAGLAGAECELPRDFLDKIQAEVTGKYTEMLQHIRTAWVFQKESITGWKIMDQAMEKMRHLAHFAEEMAENGVPPQFKPGQIDTRRAVGQALQKALEDVRAAYERHLPWKEDAEVKKHSGLVINVDRTIQQEAFQAEELEDWIKDKP